MACSQPEVVVTGTGFSNGEYGEKEAHLPGEGVGTNGRCLSDHPTESILGGKPVRDYHSGHACQGTVTWAPGPTGLDKVYHLKCAFFDWGQGVC